MLLNEDIVAIEKPEQSFPVRYLFVAWVVRTFIFLSFNKDAALIR